eukprot:7292433-Alexandrium_andersonii.AAC.1
MPLRAQPQLRPLAAPPAGFSRARRFPFSGSTDRRASLPFMRWRARAALLSTGSDSRAAGSRQRRTPAHFL